MWQVIPDIFKLLQTDKIEFIARKKEAPDVFTFIFKKPKMSFQAGQHFLFRLKHKNVDHRGDRRVFSISSAPSDEVFSVTMRYFGNKSSSFKQAMFELKPNDTIGLRGPSPLFDSFKIYDDTLPYIYIVGGVGVTPLRSVLREMTHKNQAFKADIFYCNKDSDFIFDQELETLVLELPNLRLIKVISPDRISLKSLQQSLAKYGDSATVALAGPPEFVIAYKKMLHNLGVGKSRIRGYSPQKF